MVQHGDSVQLVLHIWESAFLLKLLFAYFIFKGIGVYSLKNNLIGRQLLTFLIILFPTHLLTNSILIFFGLMILCPPFLVRRREAARYRFLRPKRGSEWAFYSMLILVLLVVLEWMLFPIPAIPAWENFLLWMGLLLPAWLYGISLELNKLERIWINPGLLSPIFSFRRMIRSREHFSLAVTAYQWLFLGCVMILSSLSLPLAVVVSLLLLIFGAVNYFLEITAVRIQKIRLKEAVLARRRKSICK